MPRLRSLVCACLKLYYRDMSQKDEEEAVRRAPIFTAIDEVSAASLRASMTAIKVTKGQVIFKEGDSGDRLFVVISGKLKL